MKIAVRHKLSLALEPGTARAVQHLLLTPQTGPTQTVLEWSVEGPGIAGAAKFADGFGNRAMLVTQTKPEAEIVISVAGVVDTIDRNGVVGRPPGDVPPALFRRVTPATRPVGAITSRFRTTPKGGSDRIPLLHALMARVGEVLGESSQEQSQGDQGQSQSQVGERPDATSYAHAFIGAARALEIPARYVSGYLLAEDGAQSGAHAWAEAWDDGLGWIAFDPANQHCPTNRHLRVALGLDATSAMPVRSVPVIGAPTVLSLQVEAA